MALNRSGHSDERPRARIPWDGILSSAVFHIILLAAAASLTVLVIKGREKVMFDAKQPPSVPARKLQHSIRVKQMQKQVRKPQIMQRLMAKNPGSVSLPELPDIETPDMKNMHDNPMLHNKAGSNLGGLGGFGGGAGRGMTGGGGYSDTQFFGQNIRTRAVCILVDISPSVVKKGVLEEVRNEAMEMLKSLNPGTKFNAIVFVDGAKAFNDQMLFATAENREAALTWLSRNFNSRSEGNRKGYSGSTPSQAIEMAVEMGCDTMFVITDDPPYLKEGDAYTGVEIESHADDIIDFAKGIETQYGRQVKIHTICYKPWNNEKGEQAKQFLKKLARSTGGRYRLIKRKD
ncbi:MAG: hypothetical protein EOM20_08140 [Spartobacteria bacterium]|nr:hypothetical protein [Spartobacteria bacterium]